MLEQWADLKEEINKSKGLKSLSFHKLWARMLTEFSDEYPLVLRLVVIALLIPADTSECERVFSLMNDIKTSERSRLGQQNPKNLLLWHALATKVVAEKNDKLEVVGDKSQDYEAGVQGRAGDGHPQGVPRDGRPQRAPHPPPGAQGHVRVRKAPPGGEGGGLRAPCREA